jgi:hypothetical protein
MKLKTCKICKAKFSPFNTMQQVCSVKCAAEYGKRKENAKQAAKMKAYNAQTKRMRDKVKTKTEWLREAQSAFNAFVRIRDFKQPCISCQRHHSGQYHAGHYRTTKAAPQLRFNLFNVHKQCAPCNNHLSGNITEYRINLANKIGQGKLDWIESNNQEARHSIEYAKRVKRIFNKRTWLYKKLLR